ncbi:MAG TPA: Lrp/AsnC family transcriptional regulator [Candidatus Caldiarchaeum subterraneum]|uniref:Lrp/AsnC family transcriptional regulator n=1 Tax=Caldiarchaeum subterraneum TaxID=311458 RepID=A0A832ZVQ1_CALS0|nr:Lrp/AsnC family transcriptional regulator [Aigarchaeota archaeon]HIQ29742.1 Lrp/AsnC family transcriptional regulator [Candidatus Caldarchaeum subterraneum]
MAVQLDDIDYNILKVLVKDSRLSYREVAKRLGLAVGTVASRIKQLESRGVIKGYTLMLDHEKLGYGITAVTEIIVTGGKLLEVDRIISKIPNVCCVYDVTGEIDSIVVSKFRTREELSQFTKKILSIPHVERTNTHVVLTTIKEDFRLI